jgi:hypothetical protein
LTNKEKARQHRAFSCSSHQTNSLGCGKAAPPAKHWVITYKTQGFANRCLSLKLFFGLVSKSEALEPAFGSGVFRFEKVICHELRKPL